MATQVILLERVDNLGEMGEVVSVRPGFARNYLLPQKKALRASKENIAYFEGRKKALQADNDKKRKDAEVLAKKIEGLKVPLIRQASEAGQLFGSVTSRDIAAELTSLSKHDINRSMVIVNQSFKSIGLFDVDVALHPEVKVRVVVNIARTTEEAEIQAKTGKALIAESGNTKSEKTASASEDPEAALEAALEQDALEATKERQSREQEENSDEQAKSKAKSEARAVKKAKKAKDEGAEDLSELANDEE